MRPPAFDEDVHAWVIATGQGRRVKARPRGGNQVDMDVDDGGQSISVVYVGPGDARAFTNPTDARIAWHYVFQCGGTLARCDLVRPIAPQG